MLKILKNEKPLFISLLTIIILFPLQNLIISSSILNILALVIIFFVIMYSAINIAYHAENLAHKFGEPYGTMILTLSAVIVEIIMIGIMMGHNENAYLARDTIVSAVILDINGLLGLAAIIGGIKHGEQDFNFDSTNSYISMIMIAIGIAMVIPIFISASHMSSYLVFLTIAFIGMFIIFTRIQIKEHSYFFKYDYTPLKKNRQLQHISIKTKKNIKGKYEIIILLLSILGIGFLSELLSIFMGKTIQSTGLPLAIGGLTVAVISAAPELLTAIRSSIENRMQTVVNIAFGASLSTVLLTIPAMIILSLLTHHNIIFALSPIQMILLGMTIIASIIHFNDGQSNVLEGAIHFIIFIVFIFLMFSGQIS